MIEILQSILALIVTIAILVTVHEFGHFYVARRCGVLVERFSVGFGRPLVVFKRGSSAPSVEQSVVAQQYPGDNQEPLPETEYCIAMIPLGGYVKMLDEREGYVPEHLRDYAFNRQSLLARTAIVAAGPAANFLLAFVLYWLLFTAGVSGVAPVIDTPPAGSPAAELKLGKGSEILTVDGQQTRTWRQVNLALFDRLGESGAILIEVKPFAAGETQSLSIPIDAFLIQEEEPNPALALGLLLSRPPIPAVLGDILPGGAAETAGLRSGDQVLKIEGQIVSGWQGFVEMIQANPGQRLALEVDRDGQVVYLNVRPEAVVIEGATIGRIGVGIGSTAWPEELQRVVSEPLYWAWLPALEKTADMIGFTVNSLVKMVQGLISTSNLSGPITIAKIANQTAQTSLESFVTFIALVSISLGVLNLLPIPMLDGGHLFYFFIEAVTRQPVPERVQMWGLQVGMVLLVGIMMLAFYNDLLRL